MLMPGLIAIASPLLASEEKAPSDHKGVLLSEVAKKMGLPHELVGVIGSKAELYEIKLGDKFFLKLNSPEQVKKDLFESTTTGENPRYKIGEKSIISTLDTIKKTNAGDFNLTPTEESRFLICVAADKAFAHKFDTARDEVKTVNSGDLERVILWENPNATASYSRAEFIKYGTTVYKYASGKSYQKGLLSSLELEKCF